MSSNDNPLRNASGCFDFTAYEAINRADAELEQERLRKLLNTIFNICDLSGYHVEERIVLRDKRTGKIWR